jgi:hypothetical protein
MSQTKKRSPIDEKLTLAQVRARINELKPVKRIEGKGAGTAVGSSRGGKTGSGKEQR